MQCVLPKQIQVEEGMASYDDSKTSVKEACSDWKGE